jgi:two-component system sensor histidine kinase MprB
MNLRVRFALALAALAAAATITAGVTSYLATRDRLNEEVDTALQETARVANRDVRFERGAPLIDRFGGVGDRNPANQGPSPHIELYTVQRLDADGEVVLPVAFTSLPVDERDVQIARSGGSLTRTVDVDGTPYRMLTTAAPRGGALQVARELTATENLLDSLRNRYVLLSFVVSAAAAAIGWVIARRSTRKLMRLTAAVEDVRATGRIDTTVGVEGGDEAGRLANAFNGMLAALARSRDQQQQLIQDAGHELRTPLTSMRTNVALLKRGDRMSKDATKSTIDDLESELGELTSLFNELVELATDSRDEEPQQDVSLERIVQRAAPRLERRTGRTVLVDSDGGIITGRPVALERAVRNLLDNAAKFDPTGYPIEVTIRSGRVEVRDRGPGISAIDLPHVFDRFYRSDLARNQPGSGLGLAIVADIAAAHGGKAFAYNHPEGGAVVGFDVDDRGVADATDAASDGRGDG